MSSRQRTDPAQRIESGADQQATSTDAATQGELHQTHFWLRDDDLAMLDAWVYQLRRGGWRGASRSACVRAVIRLLGNGPESGAKIADEIDLAAAIRRSVCRTHR